MISFRKTIKSLYNAIAGIREALKENTFRIFIIVSCVVSFFFFYFPLNSIERAILFLTITTTISLELINSQIEKVLNILKPEYNNEVKKIKDISAGAVLVASIGAVVVGALIFLPYFL